MSITDYMYIDGEGGGLSFMFWLLVVLVPAGFVLAWKAFHNRQMEQLADEFQEAMKHLSGKPGENTLWKGIDDFVKESCEKALVNAYERAINGELGRPKTLHLATLQLLSPGEEDFTSCCCEVTFEKGQRTLVSIAWHEETKKLGSITIEPQDCELDIYKYINPSSFEQNTDTFLEHLFKDRIEQAYKMMHQHLQDKLTTAQLVKQKESVLSHMGCDRYYELDSTYHSAKSEKLGEGISKVYVLTCGLKGDDQDATGTFKWMIQGMASKLIKFEISTTGKPNKQTLFVHPDGTRIDSVS
eukprot:TRINITY_DN4658_c0_g1_i1.p1 TRINITY_DN4658_c0_g1~~TRINITY_DN4658_c0_g1_i1.p1  ORF type:complete len:299 (+),score=65.95 TRINITY_DN4658_c0_g1_i1:91-987(+)